MAKNRAINRDGDAAVGSMTAKEQRGPSAEPAVPDAETKKKSPKTAAAKHARQEIVVHIDVHCGGITNFKSPVAIGPRYQGLPLAGPAKAFDCLLDSWLTRSLDLGMIGSGLGQLFPVSLQHHNGGSLKVEHLLLVGMGEPGQFAQDDLRYLMSNVTVAVKAMRQYQFSTILIGTRRNELPIDHAVHGFLEGIRDGYERFRAIAAAVKELKEEFREAAARDLFVSIVEPPSESPAKSEDHRAKQIFDAFRDADQIFGDADPSGVRPKLHLEVTWAGRVPDDPEPEKNAEDVEPDVPVTLLRVTRQEAEVVPSSSVKPLPAGTTGIETFCFSALSDAAAVTVREQEVSSYFVRELPERMTAADSPEEQQDFGTFFANYLIPSEFHGLMEKDISLTFIVDEATAAYPWEMAAHNKYSRTGFLGTTRAVSRRFHTLMSPPPSSLPPLNEVLKILIIADPAPGDLSLPHAREEAAVILEVLDHVRKVWEKEYTFEATVRIGHKDDDLVRSQIEKTRQLGDWVKSVEPCDPVKLAMLIVNEHYDVIHYAGHGFCDPESKRAGWVFDRDCRLTAQEIFKVRQVPRLVFANACFSSVTTDKPIDHSGQRRKMVGLAQAFFARGIPNYIGAGWQVEDACARECARTFYSYVLGLHGRKSPPATIGEALLKARNATRDFKNASTTWGAYQHYGAVGDKLLPLPNANASPAQARDSQQAH